LRVVSFGSFFLAFSAGSFFSKMRNFLFFHEPDFLAFGEVFVAGFFFLSCFTGSAVVVVSATGSTGFFFSGSLFPSLSSRWTSFGSVLAQNFT